MSRAKKCMRKNMSESFCCFFSPRYRISHLTTPALAGRVWHGMAQHVLMKAMGQLCPLTLHIALNYVFLSIMIRPTAPGDKYNPDAMTPKNTCH